jgi:zinc transport system permease protein
MIELFFLPFFQRAILVGLILGVLLAVIGVLVVLRRMSFFADAIGHSALTGIAIGLLLNINPFMAAIVFSILLAGLIAYVRQKSELHFDTLLGVFFPAAVALGVILIQLTPGFQTDLISFLFGDILTVSPLDVGLSGGLAIIVLTLLLYTGKALLTIAFDASLAKSQGIAVAAYELLFLLMLASVIALSIKLVGVILVTAMLVIPAASAHNMARSLGTMFGLSVAFSVLAVLFGMIASAILSVPSGPTIVLASAMLFTLTFVWRVTKSASL